MKVLHFPLKLLWLFFSCPPFFPSMIFHMSTMKNQTRKSRVKTMLMIKRRHIRGPHPAHPNISSFNTHTHTQCTYRDLKKKDKTKSLQNEKIGQGQHEE
ncbi:hypothetical protein V8C34DRAFT_288296 [Trichoderma compactum]